MTKGLRLFAAALLSIDSTLCVLDRSSPEGYSDVKKTIVSSGIEHFSHQLALLPLLDEIHFKQTKNPVKKNDNFFLILLKNKLVRLIFLNLWQNNC